MGDEKVFTCSSSFGNGYGDTFSGYGLRRLNWDMTSYGQRSGGEFSMYGVEDMLPYNDSCYKPEI